MNFPYHLNQYESKINSLSKQAKSILEFCVSHRECEKFHERINEEENLEKDTIQILREAILAGYYNSIYTYSWKYEEELKLWELINSKCREEDKVYFVLANIQSLKKPADELKDLYFKAFDQYLDYVFSLEDKSKEQLYNNPNTRYEFLKYEFRARITQWDDFEDNWNEGKSYWQKKFANDEKANQIINELLNERREQNNK